MSRHTLVAAVRLVALAHVGLAAAAASTAWAGPLNPPAGPIASTAKPLAEVEPRIAINATNTPGDSANVAVITLSGSYYLTGNLQGASGKTGLLILAPNVTVDLQGYTVQGVPGAFVGITGSGGDNVTIRNGVVDSWPSGGINLTFVNLATVENVVARANGAVGVRTGANGALRHCTLANNAGTGAVMGSGAMLEWCEAVSNTAGFNLQTDGVAHDSVARANSGTGFALVARCSLRHCAAYTNTTGVNAGFGSSVDACTLEGNTSYGLLIDSACTVTANTCVNNGTAPGPGAGISVTGTNNRIESNVCSINFRGIDVSGTANILVRNTCSASTNFNWNIGPANSCLVVTAIVTPGFSGNAGGGSIGSTDPNANYTY